MSEDQAEETPEGTQPQSNQLPPEQGDAAVPASAPVVIAAAPLPFFFKRRRLLLILALLIVLGGTVGGFVYLGLSHSSRSAVDNRHGLPGDIPLPANSTFINVDHSGTLQDWLYTIPITPDEVNSFYDAQLPGNGWTLISTGGNGKHSVLAAMKGDRNLAVASSTQQAGGVLLEIRLY